MLLRPGKLVSVLFIKCLLRRARKAGYASTYFLSESCSSKATCTYSRLGSAVIDGIFIQNESSLSCCIAHSHLIPPLLGKLVESSEHWLIQEHRLYRINIYNKYFFLYFI
jgi:hypothetical protein